MSPFRMKSRETSYSSCFCDLWHSSEKLLYSDVSVLSIRINNRTICTLRNNYEEYRRNIPFLTALIFGKYVVIQWCKKYDTLKIDIK